MRTVFNYSDGNGNRFWITNCGIDYKPIQVNQSSSGYFDGGLPIRKEISKKQYNSLVETADSLIKNTSIHLEKRIKTSGMLVITAGEENAPHRFLLKSSDEKDYFEKLLRFILYL